MFWRVNSAPLRIRETKMRRTGARQNDWAAMAKSIEEIIYALMETGLCDWCTAGAGFKGSSVGGGQSVGERNAERHDPRNRRPVVGR